MNMTRLRLVVLCATLYPVFWVSCAFIGRRKRGYWPSVGRVTIVLGYCIKKIWRENSY